MFKNVLWVIYVLLKIFNKLSTLNHVGNYKAKYTLKNVIILGGGLAGLISAIQLSRKGIFCTVIERKSYPFHRVCGEYISNEVVPFLGRENLFPSQFAPAAINRFQLSSVKGKSTTLPLDLGGFGISRYTFDHYLYQIANEQGVNFLLNTEAEEITYAEKKFQVKVSTQYIESDVVIGCFGKRSKLDLSLKRHFITRRSPYVGVKYHIKTAHPADLIALHNFPGGYCGVSNVENGIVNLCYLVHRDFLKESGGIRELEESILCKNPLLRDIFKNSEFLFKKPETINEISFETKGPVEDHILMAGDAAGMIAPLCGNGMSMAIHAASVLSELVIKFCVDKTYTRTLLETQYEKTWNKLFSRRLWAGRQIQKLFGSELASGLAINLALNVKPVASFIMKNTHGKPF